MPRGPDVIASLSSDGRLVAFASAKPLVPRDTNNKPDVYVKDMTTGAVERVSVSTSGVQGNGASERVAMSVDGRYVAFESASSTLVQGDSNGVRDVFVRDRTRQVTTRVSVSTAGAQGNGGSFAPTLSADGRYVAFESDASNLAASGDRNGRRDVFLRDRTSGKTVMISVSTAGAPSDDHSWDAQVSPDGSAIAFESLARRLDPAAPADDVPTDRFVYLRQRGATPHTYRYTDLDADWADYNFTGMGVPTFAPDNATVVLDNTAGSSFGRPYVATWFPARPQHIDSRWPLPYDWDHGYGPISLNADGSQAVTVFEDRVAWADAATAATASIAAPGNSNVRLGFSGNGRYVAFLSAGSVKRWDRQLNRVAVVGPR